MRCRINTDELQLHIVFVGIALAEAVAAIRVDHLILHDTRTTQHDKI